VFTTRRAARADLATLVAYDKPGRAAVYWDKLAALADGPYDNLFTWPVTRAAERKTLLQIACSLACPGYKINLRGALISGPDTPRLRDTLSSMARMELIARAA
jgi:hypothetical protein